MCGCSVDTLDPGAGTDWFLVNHFTPTHNLNTTAPPIWWTTDQDQYSVTRVSLKILCNVLMITRNITAVVEMVQGVCAHVPCPSIPQCPAHTL